MLRTFGPVLFGATTQLMAVVLLTAAFYALAQSGFPASQWPSMLCEMSCHSPSLLVRLAYLLTALGIALTSNSIIARATAWIRQASPAPHTDAFSPRAATVQLSIPAIAIVIAELNSSSEIAVAIGQWLERPWIGAILPPALWSMGLAGIGSMIHATFRAVPHWDL